MISEAREKKVTLRKNDERNERRIGMDAAKNSGRQKRPFAFASRYYSLFEKIVVKE